MIRIRASRDRSPRTSTTSAVLGCGSMRWLARNGADILLKALVERGTGTSSPKTTRREHLYPFIDAIFVGVCSAADSLTLPSRQRWSRWSDNGQRIEQVGDETLPTRHARDPASQRRQKQRADRPS